MATHSVDFVASDDWNEITFIPGVDDGTLPITIDNVSLKAITGGGDSDNLPVAEFLTGNSDFAGEIFFRADTQIIQLDPNPEMFATINSLVTETERGTLLKTFISIDDGPFYEIEGTVTKGISTLKFKESKMGDIKPPITKTIQVSYRDSSKMLPRILQMAIIFVRTPIDHAE